MATQVSSRVHPRHQWREDGAILRQWLDHIVTATFKNRVLDVDIDVTSRAAALHLLDPAPLRAPCRGGSRRTQRSHVSDLGSARSVSAQSALRRPGRSARLLGVAGRINHRGWIVLESVSSGDMSLCVDFFEDPDGGYGFEHLRADPEDGGRWTAIGSHAGVRFRTALDAADAAAAAVPWLGHETAARTLLEHWKQTVASS